MRGAVVVNNNLEDEGTSLHWHGLLQKATPWFEYDDPGMTSRNEFMLTCMSF